MINISERALVSILEKSKRQNSFENALIKAGFDYQLKPYNVMKLNPDKIHEIYKVILRKFYISITDIENQFWYENQLRIFVWVVIIYSHLNNKTIEDLQQKDWNELSLIFNGKNPITLQFQALCLLRRRKSKKWCQEQIKLMIHAINQKPQKNRWNQIAKSIFVNSNKKYFRSPKQCRQQWINHLDPTKSKTQWKTIEDYQLIKGILRNGKKWSKIAKEIGNHRTQHMVKNRFKSLLNLQMKKMLDCQEEDMLILKIKQRLQSNGTIKKYINKKIDQNNKCTLQEEIQHNSQEIQTKQKNENIQQKKIETYETQDSLIYKILQLPQISVQKLQDIKQWKIKKQQLMQQYQKQEKQYKFDKYQRKTKQQQEIESIKSNNEKWMLKQQPEVDDLDIQHFLVNNIDNESIQQIENFFQ